MASVKALLKAAADATRQQKWDTVIEIANEVIQKDANNHQSHVFLAFALDKKNNLDESEAAYLTATTLKPNDPQAWQGLIKLYQRHGVKKIKQYQYAALRLAEIFRDVNEMFKCQDVVDKFIDHARSQGDRQHYVDALDLILPESPIYSALEGRVPAPAKTYETQAQIIETDEKKRINTLIGERRTRIGARIADVTLEVKREVYHKSRLGYVYRQIIDWSSDDELRRTYEEKLLQYCHDRLLAWPPGEQKDREAALVRKLADDMVIIKHPYKFAWDIAINWQDHKDIRGWDVTALRQYCLFFPDSDLSRVIMGFLTSFVSPFPKLEKEKAAKKARTEDESEDDEEGGAATTYVPVTEEDRLLMMTEGISGADSLLAFRLMGEYYQFLEEHESNFELMRRALDHLKEERARTGLEFRSTEDAFSLYLGTSLVFYQSPRHHQEAKGLFDGILARDPASTSALIGVGLIFEEEEEYGEAISFLERALERAPDNLRVRSEAAWVKALEGNFQDSASELARCVSQLTEKGQSINRELLAQTQYRLGYCAWHIDTSRTARKNRSGAYSYFLEALKSNLNYAPAYTSLGIYYADYANDKKRARKCFQKAVELSPSEVEAAERLARSFADDGDWDRVELVAQRVVDSGKVKPPPGSKRKGISWPFAALGVAELNKQDYHKAIVSFQAALRISPNDYHSWVGLGESYYGSGMYMAATKALLNAQRLEGVEDSSTIGETWFTNFILADVKRELGEFDEAIILYHQVMKGRPREEGVAIALMQALVENAMDSLDKGLFGKAVDHAKKTLTFATEAPAAITSTFNFWKAIADACSVFSHIQGCTPDFPADQVRSLLGEDDGIPEYQVLSDIDGVGTGVGSTGGMFPADEMCAVDLTKVLQAAILAHKRAIHVSANDAHAQAVAYYNLGWAEYRAHGCMPREIRKKSTRYLKAAMACFKRAIELEAGNSEFWNALGVVTSEVNPTVAQHSFARSLYLNERGAHVWGNLGTLGLIQGDIPIANEAFTKAQSADPDYSHAWLGQGFVALLLGDAKEARGLFTHAIEIAENSSVATRRHYSVSVFDHISASFSDQPITLYLQPLLALAKLQALQPHDPTHRHLAALFHERIHDSTRSITTLEELCAAIEANYETTESPETLKRFAIAKSDLARSYLAVGSFDKAIKAAELALQLSSDNSSESELTGEERRKLRLSAHVIMGLAQHHNKNTGDAIPCFETALQESDGNPYAACVLSQILWATGREENRERAREVLFEVIEKTPQHVQSVLLLGVIALLDGDEESLEAVLQELQALRASEGGVSPEEQSHLGEVMRAIAALDVDAAVYEGGSVSQAQTDTMLHPELPHGWSELAALGGAEGKGAAEMALRVALKSIPPRGPLGAEDLARAYAGTGRVADAQTAILIAPWDGCGWATLSEAVNS